jgi:hypothetical protein
VTHLIYTLPYANQENEMSYHHHHHWQNSPFRATAFLRKFSQFCPESDNPILTFLDFATINFL